MDHSRRTLIFFIFAFFFLFRKCNISFRAALGMRIIYGKTPSDTPIPQGSNTYIEYNNYSCESSYKPLWDIGNVTNPGETAYMYGNRDSIPYRDLYMVYNDLKCYITRDPINRGACDLWLKETELGEVLEAVENGKNNKTREDERKTDESYRSFLKPLNYTSEQKEKFVKEYRDFRAQRYFTKTAFRHITYTCRLAFSMACGEPDEVIYDPITCNNSRAEWAEERGQNNRSDTHL